MLNADFRTRNTDFSLTFLSIVVAMVEVEVMVQAGVRDGFGEVVWPVACRGALQQGG